MTALIALDHVTVLRAGRVVLDGVSLALHPGERLAIAGANGAGKTTLLRTIVGLETATSGAVSLLGKVRHVEKDFREARAKIAYLFQDPDDQLFCPTVLDDVAFGPLNIGLSQKDAMAKAQATLEVMNLGHLADRVTHRLSGGEKRLVSLASILAMDPEALLLDEPTNGLDESYLAHFMKTLQSLGTAMVIVSHDWSFLSRLSTRVAVLKSGRLTKAVFHRHPHAHDHIHIHAEE